jgi:MSHA biogenesis protein MshK
MAGVLMKLGADHVRAAAAGLLLAATTIAAGAENLPDPTRPPAAVESATPAAGQAPAPTGLQSIIRSNRGKPAAIINGEYVVLGGQVGDARLVKIGEDSVTLKSSSATEIMKLLPGVEKTPVSARAMESGKEGTGAAPKNKVMR